MGEKGKTILAMSGGVDSSVAAALLKKRGYDVRGVFMRLWKSPNYAKEYAEIGGKADVAEKSAKAVAKKLGIPLKIIDFKKEFKKAVVDYFLKEFARARTPNPCVVCNQKIKFGLLLDKALEMGGDYVATGHYARIKREAPKPKHQIPNKSQISNSKLQHHLFAGKDKTKDQSYFLYNLTQNKLKRILFPIGDYTKKEVYQMAEKWRLPFQKKESVDICFLRGQDHRDFLKKYLNLKPGKIVDVSGKILGEHKGLSLYTIGQRADIGGPGPYYIVEMNLKENKLVVTNHPRDLMLFKKSLIAANVNWISGIKPKLPFSCSAKIRYGHPAMPATIYRGSISMEAKVEFKTPQRAITPGQSVVFYKRNEVLGGGVIEK